MTLDGTDSNAVTLPSGDESYVLILDVFHSKDRARKDPRKLPGLKEFSTNLQVFTVRFIHKSLPLFALSVLRHLDLKTRKVFLTFRHSR